MKNLKKVLGITLILLVGFFLGYKISSNEIDKKSDCNENKMITFDEQLDGRTINQTLESYNKDKSKSGISSFFKIFTSRHAITSIEHIKMRNDFWGTTSPDSISYDRKTIEDICDLYLPNQDQDWIEFKPSNLKKSKDIGYKPVKTFDKTTSCYYIPFFLGIKNLMKNPGDKLYITKGQKDIVVNGNPPVPYTVIIFRLVLDGNPIHMCYNISTDSGA